MYQALYRKWRPKTFDEVVGQEHITATLKRQVASGRLSHAYLFVGTRGTGKTTCAKILARAVNCENPVDGNPCNVCPSCRGILDGSILDVLELDAASNNGVDNVRALRDEAVFSPVDVKKRVYIVDEVHMLSTSAFNALLKILEEPPAHLMFILATTEIHKVPATIVSRCQRFTFKRLGRDVIAGRLLDIAQRESLALTEDAAAALARLADGSMRDALSLLDQCTAHETIDTPAVLSSLGLAGTEDISDLFTAILDGDTARSLSLLDTLYMGGKVIASLLEELSALVRDTLLSILMPSGAPGLLSGAYDKALLQDLSRRVTAERLQLMLETLRDTQRAIASGASARLSAELCLMRLCRPDMLAPDTAALTARVAELERRLASLPPAGAYTPPGAPSPKAGPSRRVPDPAPAAQKSAAADTPPFDGPPAGTKDDAPFDRDDEPPFAPPYEIVGAPPAPPRAAKAGGAGKKPPVDLPPDPDLAPLPGDEDAPPFELEAPPAPREKEAEAPVREASQAEPKASEADGAPWAAILREAERLIDIPEYILLSDSAHVTAWMEGAALCVSALSFLGEGVLNKDAVRQALQKAAEKAMGRPVNLRFTSGQPKTTPKPAPGAPAQPRETPQEDKLDRLGRFSIVKFED